jgi:hypothetical protein
LLIAALWMTFCVSMLTLMIMTGIVGAQRYGGIGPAYSTLSSGFWFSFTQTAGAPAAMTGQTLYYQTATAGVPATLTADVFYRQTSTAGVIPSMTGQAQSEQTGTAGVIPSLTGQYDQDQTSTAGVPATVTAAAAATQAANLHPAP